jgi:hypothetical protein
MDVRRAESPGQHLMAGPAALDPRRAEAASKHVRALNTQFARLDASPSAIACLARVISIASSEMWCCPAVFIVSSLVAEYLVLNHSIKVLHI